MHYDNDNGASSIAFQKNEYYQLSQIFTQGLIDGLFKDQAFDNQGNQVFISFKQNTNDLPLISVKKEWDKGTPLYTATQRLDNGQLSVISATRKFNDLTLALKKQIDNLSSTTQTPQKCPYLSLVV